MVRAWIHALAVAATLATSVNASLADLKLCKLPNYNLQKAADNYPELSAAIKTVLAQGVATWYTDRVTDAEHKDFLNAIQTSCSTDETELIAVYGLPQKDCADGYSSSGGNRNSDDYKKWITDLANAVGTRKVVYVYEPDALALTIDNKCGNQWDYLPNIRTGLSILSQNPNAKIYLDVGYWTLQWPALLSQIITNFKSVESAGRIAGITIGTSNYRPLQEMVGLCGNFSREYGSAKYNCILDTSRDYADTVPGTEWCNQMWAGVGHPSTGETGYSNIDAFLWVKPVGESDGTCNGGPTAGQFWYEGFVKWWNQGWFVQKGLMPVLTQTTPGQTASPTPTPTTSKVVPTPSVTPLITTPPTRQCYDITCPAVKTPVCGRDRNGNLVTYVGSCEFGYYACRDPRITFVHDGACETPTPTPKTTTPTPTPTPTPTSGGVAGHWAQCGGNGYSGPTTCQAPYTCVITNQWYSQCL